MNATMPRTVRTTLFDMKQLPDHATTLGKEGLQNLIAAIRRMIGWLLSPFKAVARVLLGPSATAAADQSAVSTTNDVPIATPPVSEQVNFPATVDEPGMMQALDDGGMADQILANGGGAIDVELQGPPEEIDAILPMLQKHVGLLLKSYLPADADALKVEARVVALAETAEYVRYAHHIVSRQVAGMVQGIAENPLYSGMSQNTILELVRTAGESGVNANANGSDEERLLARLALQEKLGSDYEHQLRQIAQALVQPAKVESDSEGEGAPAGQHPLQAVVLQAADMARRKLLQHGTILQTTLEEMPVALNKAIEAAKASIKLVEVKEVEVASVASVPAEAPDVAQAAPALAAPAPAPAAAAPVAAKPAGMFGSGAVVRTAAEMDEANIIDDDMPEMEGMVVG